jgi:hypothetical protein
VIFAREITPPLTSLVKKIDEATVKNNSCDMGSFVVLLSDEKPTATRKLKELAKTQKLKETVLALHDAAGPEEYKIAKDAEITVLLYVEHEVKANFAFRKGEFEEKDISRVLDGLVKILPQKK